jgi:hypothetical protein
VDSRQWTVKKITNRCEATTYFILFALCFVLSTLEHNQNISRIVAKQQPTLFFVLCSLNFENNESKLKPWL